jgi:hypothetical protein
MKFILTILMIILVLIVAGCVSENSKLTTSSISDTSKTQVSTSILTTQPTLTPLLITQDPIIGSWRNDMIFYINGTVIVDSHRNSRYDAYHSFYVYDDDGTQVPSGLTSWKKNENVINSYFVIYEGLDPNSWINPQRTVIATEWIYNPSTDSINKRGSSNFIFRGNVSQQPKKSTAIATNFSTNNSLRLNDFLNNSAIPDNGFLTYPTIIPQYYDFPYPTIPNQVPTMISTPAPTVATPVPTAIPTQVPTVYPVPTLPPDNPNPHPQWITPTIPPT